MNFLLHKPYEKESEKKIFELNYNLEHRPTQSLIYFHLKTIVTCNELKHKISVIHLS